MTCLSFGRRCACFVWSLALAVSLVGGLGARRADALDALWDFDGDLTATLGSATMSYRGDMGNANVDFFASEHDLGLPMPFGDRSGVMRFQPTTPTQGLEINLNNGGATVSNYTMVWDLFRPGPSWNSWQSLYQTDVTNTSDGEFFINPNDGIGISGAYHGTVSNGRGNIQWNRIAVTRAADGTMKKYIDGNLVGTQTAAGARWDITGGKFDILADEDGETSLGFLSSFRFVDSVLSDGAIANLGAVHAGGAATPGKQIATPPAPLTPGAFTVAFVGDTQNYSSDYPAIFNQVTQWLVDNKAARNIQFVVQDGDIVNGDATNQWNNARAALSKLDGVIPYATVRGNHDIGSQFDFVSRFGPGSPYSQQPTLVDHFEVPGQPTWDMRNTAHKFEANGQKFLIVTIDISAGNNVVAWANDVIAANPDRRVILDTHAYMYDGGERFNNAADPENPGHTHDQSRDELLRTGTQIDSIYNGAAYGGQDAESLWNALVKNHANVSLFLSGHQFEDFDQFKYHLDTGVNGNRVHELLVDPQNMANGGNGWIRLLEFDPDGMTVHVKTYSPFLNQWDTSPDNFYDIRLSPIVPGDFDYDGVVDGDDFLVWQRQLGSTTDLAADGNDDGVVDQADLAIWKSHYGPGGIAATAVNAVTPEPRTLLASAQGLLVLAGLARRLGSRPTG
ncbi:MAG: metallophosphoesterase [Planctomycetaceae bacterium]|nr:metallophosphoesterase [Planctomycetaceae bacterium]